MKRAFDLGLTVALLPVWGLMLLLAMAAVYLVMGRPVFYVSPRAGKDGRVFDFLKLRTMRLGPGSDGERLTKLGKFLRKTSIDELPQLLHVLSGKMSLVGPRPLPARYLPRYSAWQRRRHEVRPGSTGWAQVNGRNALEWDEKFRLDVWYVEHRNLNLDLRILALTAKKCLDFAGVNHPKYDTMVEFKGETDQ